ncbi:MAG: hypothetical protein JSS60_06755 [Verrucomicrobia bacterium]|nr:hypothetical protein [Verrucomicrobiota bacterium]
MRFAILSLGIGAAALAGCESDAGTGAIVGAGLGAGTGALISPTAGGVLIGAGVGAATGAIVGAALDAHDRDNVQRSSPQTMKKIDHGEQLSIDDIKKMSEAGIADDKIIGTIQSTGSVYHLSSSDVKELKQDGVSQRVIDYMLQTAYE